MNIQKLLFLSLALFFLSCSSGEISTKKVVNATPEEAMANFDKAQTLYIKGKSISVFQGVATKELFDFFALDDKYKKREIDENYEIPPITVNCTTTGEEAVCACKMQGSEHETKYFMVKQGNNWLVAGMEMLGIVTSELVALRKEGYESKK